MPLKVVILWAGCGRRIRDDYPDIHKAMIPLNGKPLLAYLLQNIKDAGFEEIIPILGYKKEFMLNAIQGFASFARVIPVFNPVYEKTNNLASLICAEELLSGKEFIVINGDMVFDRRILIDAVAGSGNAVVTDMNSYPTQLDSPRVVIQNEHITDIGRHLTINHANGYAIGIYRFSAESSAEYFRIGQTIAKKNPNAGYHEPIVPLTKVTVFKPIPTGQYRWMDVDDKMDVPKAEALLHKLEDENC